MPDSALHHFLEAGFYGLYRYVGIMACEIRTSPSAIEGLKHESDQSDPMQSDEAFDFDPGYRLAARGRQEAEDERLALLERIFDPLSRRRRELVQPGWRCLEVGAGRGSMAVWLAEQVGETGEVVATDIDVTYLKQLNLPNLEVRQHNILNDPLDALGPGSFDLVCSRLLLFWLAGKQEAAIRRMVECGR